MFSFLGIGAQKSGTTWLYSMLSQHPSVYFPFGKEAHFWNKQHPKIPANQYLSAFSRSEFVGGDITPAYAFLPESTIRALYRIKPNLRLIYIIRNPIDRAWSSALMALQRAEMEFNEASDRWFIDHFRSKGSLLRGDHETNLKAWCNVYPRANILILKYQDISRLPEELLIQCCNFLDIDKFDKDQLSKMAINQRVFSGSGQELSLTLRKELISIYKDKITSLSNYLDEDFTAWIEAE